MYNASPTFQTAIKGNGRFVKATVTVAGHQIKENDLLQSLEIIRDTKTDGKIIGNVVSKKATIKTLGLPYSLKNGDALSIQLGAQLPNTTVEYVPFSAMTVDSVDINKVNKLTTITAYDAMQKFNSYKASDLPDMTFPMTLSEYVGGICTLCGVTLEAITWTDTTIDSEPNLTGNEPLRDLIGWVAEAYFANAVINRDGKLQFKRVVGLGSSVLDITTSDYFKLEIGEKFGVINQLVLARSPQEDNVYAKDDTSIALNGLTELRIDNNPFIDYGTTDRRYDSIGGLFDIIKGFSYHPFALEWRGNPTLDEGDVVKLYNLDGSTITTIYFGDKIVYNGGLRVNCNISAYTQTQTATRYGLTARDNKRNVELRVDKVEGSISAVIEEQDTIKGLITDNYDDLTDSIEVLRSELTLRADAIEAAVSRTGGNNLIQNSVGFKGFEYWTQTGFTGSTSQTSTEEQQTVSGSVIIANNGSIHQNVSVIDGKPYNLSFSYKKGGVGEGASKITILNGTETILVLDTADTVLFYTLISNTFVAKASSITIKIESINDDFTIADLRLTYGESGQTWSQHKDEVYGKGLKLDRAGLSIDSLSGETVSLVADNDSIVIKDNGTTKAELSDERVYGQTLESANGLKLGNVEFRMLSSSRFIIAGV